MRGAPGLCERRAGWTTDSNHRIRPAEPPMNGPLPPRSRGRSATTAGATDGLGDYQGSDVMLNDFVLIGEFDGFYEDPAERLAKLHALGDEAAARFLAVLPDALERFRRVIVLTHVPPFREACWHEGKVSDDNWLPFFSCKAVGDALVGAMTAALDRKMTVLCGHTHGGGEAEILPNLRVLTGGARYGN